MWAEAAGKSRDDERKKKRYRATALTVSSLIGLLGIAAVAGWLLEVEVIVSVVPDFPAMAFNTALCFILSGFALAGSVSTRRRFNIAASVFAAGVIAITGGGGGYQNHVRFTVADHDYVVFEAVAGELTDVPGKRWSGVYVQRGEKHLATLTCGRERTTAGDLRLVEDLAPANARDSLEEDDPRFEAWF